MKTPRLAGLGPIAAIVSAASLLALYALQLTVASYTTTGPASWLLSPEASLLAQWLWVAGLAVVVFDLGWLGQSGINARWIRIGQGAALVALAMATLLALASFTTGTNFLVLAYPLMFLGVATTLLVHNLEGRRIGLLRGVLPWLGVAAAVLYVVAVVTLIGILVPSFGIAILVTGIYVSLLAQVIYAVWATWMAVRLIRARAASSQTNAQVRPAD